MPAVNFFCSYLTYFGFCRDPGASMKLNFLRLLTCVVYLVTDIFVVSYLTQEPYLRGAIAKPQEHSIFERFPGRWVGKGRLVFRDGKVEEVKCRVTYFVSDDALEMRQNIRCATASGKIEVKSVVKNNGGNLTGTWRETIYELSGELTGRPTEHGLVVFVKSGDVQANMQLIIREGQQIAEIQFNNDVLLGLTLILRRG